MRKFIFCVIFLLITSDNFAATYFMPDDCANLEACFSVMSGGEELIIRDGTYTGSENVIDNSNHPPQGISREEPTIIRAENVGQVLFDGENTNVMFYITGTPGGRDWLQYWKFQGLQWIRSSERGIFIASGDSGDDFTTDDYGASLPDNYIIFKECGFHGEGNSVHLQLVKLFFFEDCWTWGNGRYGYQLYLSDYVIIRRNIDRRDNVNAEGSRPSASYISYASHYVEYQNCISVDIDNHLWDEDLPGKSYHDPYGGFYVRNSYGNRLTDDTHFRGCMVLNYNASKPSTNDTRIAGWYFQADPTDTTLDNCIVWGSSKGIYSNTIPDTITINHCTVGGSQYQTGGTWQYAFGDRFGSYNSFNVLNSVAFNNSFLYGAYNLNTDSDYNNIFDNSDDNSNGANDLHEDPQIDYILRIEPDSPNYGTASDGGNRGATVLKRYGIDGTFYGDPGYDTLTNVDLWPWPNEDIIRDAFRCDYGSTDETRGFCADGQTLTKYIWEYAGNPIPDSIYEQNGGSAPILILLLTNNL